AAGESESYLDGRSRRITVRSIKAYIARQLAAAPKAGAPSEAAPQPRRRRGRPRKRAITPSNRNVRGNLDTRNLALGCPLAQAVARAPSGAVIRKPVGWEAVESVFSAA